MPIPDRNKPGISLDYSPQSMAHRPLTVLRTFSGVLPCPNYFHNKSKTVFVSLFFYVLTFALVVQKHGEVKSLPLAYIKT